MKIKKSIGRPIKVDYRTIEKLADAIQHNSSITEACSYAGVSRDTYYRYMNNELVFAEKMNEAMENRNKAPLTFLTH